MKKLVLSAAALLMMAGIYAGASQPTRSAQEKTTVVVADGTAPVPLCDPNWTKCPKAGFVK